MGNFVELKLGDEDIKAFFDNDFAMHKVYSTPIHRHRYSEIHIVVSGRINYTVENKTVILEEGMAVYIPSKQFHTLCCVGENAKFIAFQIDLDYDILKCCKLSEQTFESFLNTNKANEGKIEKIVPYVYWIISELISDIQVSVKKNTDYSYLIYEFLGANYDKNICLADLAAALHISEKQTQRIVKRETGNTFLKELTFYRMKMAEYLITTSNVPLNKVAEYVGYKSYSGFWKAYGRYKTEKAF